MVKAMHDRFGEAQGGGRVEDFRLIRGEGRFADDLRLPGQLVGTFVRSPHAHARIVSVDCTAARQAPGVIDALTAHDMQAAAIGNLSAPPPMTGRDGRSLIVPFRPALAGDRVRHVGDAVALVVAETPQAALDAAELVAIEYEELPAATSSEAVLAAEARQLWPEAAGNVAIDWPGPVPDATNEAEVERILHEAAHRVRIKVVNQRVAGVPLEPRGATASFDPASGRYTLHVGSQGVGPLRAQLAAIMGVEPRAIRVLTDDVGGGFGLKTPAYPEYPALMIAARKLGRPVHWIATRAESFLTDNQGRDNVTTAELALDSDGRFLALRVDAVTNVGAYVSPLGVHIATNNFGRCFPTVYDIPRLAIGVRCVFSNTVPTGPYRGAGRPEANYVMERLVEAAARQIGIDTVALRRRNLVRPVALPHATAVGTVIDSGEFEAILDRALALSSYASFEDRRRAAAAERKLRGIGISMFLEHAGGMPLEGADLSFAEPGRVVLGLGVQSTGQGHATLFRDMLARQLGIPSERVIVRQGDSDLGLRGGPSVASRSTMTVSAAALTAVELLIEKGRRLAADALEAAASDIVYSAGAFEVVGTDRRIGLFDLAERAAAMKARGETGESLDTRAEVETPQSFPNGCHVAEVEIDAETGRVRIVNYVAVDDCGTVLNHTLVEGQVLGGLAQGIGQALLEEVVYAPGSGQLVSGTFNDYAMPRADVMPPVLAAEHPVPCRTNPLGVKGVGEAGTTGAMAAVMNAIADAIPGGRGTDLQMPATPEKVWRACQGRAGSPAS
jgi:carbon-monoxide dehydrogenase large subunit